MPTLTQFDPDAIDVMMGYQIPAFKSLDLAEFKAAAKTAGKIHKIVKDRAADVIAMCKKDDTYSFGVIPTQAEAEQVVVNIIGALLDKLRTPSEFRHLIGAHGDPACVIAAHEAFTVIAMADRRAA